MLSILTLVLIASGTYIAYLALSLYHNYRTCVQIGLPIIVSPTATLNPVWIILYNVFPSILKLLESLPLDLGQWASYTHIGWQYSDVTTHRIHEKLGPAFIVCTPSINEIHIADPTAANAVLSSRKAFIKPSVMYDALNVFGRNVDTVEGEDWQRHRKITAPNFNERVSVSVWNESVRQNTDMLQCWLEKGEEGTRDTVEDTAKMTLHIFTFAGFGLQYPFRSLQNHVEIAGRHKMSYVHALGTIITNFTYLAVLPISVLKWSIWPEHMRNIGAACDEYALYLREFVDREKARVDNDAGDNESSNLLRALVSANKAGQKAGSALNDEEVYGNLFVFNFAGHETTANAVATCIAYLAATPKWQDWIHEEIEAVTNGNPESWNYEESFPRLKRCRSVMYETLRLNNSAPFIPKAAAAPFQTVTIGDRTHVIPADTFVITNVQALHCDKKSWGEDALIWRPDRWIEKPKSGLMDQEVLIEPAPGTFVAWAAGPRTCPGKKFSQVEFAASMAVLFRNHTVNPQLDPGERSVSARDRTQKMISNSGITAVTLQMKSPRDVAFVWRSRQGGD